MELKAAMLLLPIIILASISIIYVSSVPERFEIPSNIIGTDFYGFLTKSKHFSFKNLEIEYPSGNYTLLIYIRSFEKNQTYVSAEEIHVRYYRNDDPETIHDLFWMQGSFTFNLKALDTLSFETASNGLQ